MILFSGILILNNKQEENSKVCFEKSCFNVELAKTTEEKSKGLMFRESLDENKGMLFVYSKEGNYSFWMKNTLIPLDIIWIDSNDKVVYVKNNAQPCNETCKVFSPGKNAKYVLEINGGLAEKLRINLGKTANVFG